MNRVRYWLAALAAAAGLPAAAGDYSDLWWNPQESGWGMNVVQQDDTAFVTLFVYAPDGRPTWYVAPAARIGHIGAGGPQFSGALYRTRGPWHAGPFDPAAVQVIAVGTLTLEVLARERMRVHYDAEGVVAVKEVVRQTWDAPVLDGFFLSQFALRQAHPGGPSYGTRIYPADVYLRLESGEGLMRVQDDLGRTCEYRGAHTQSGKFARLAGTFACTSGDALAGSFELRDLEAAAHGLTGHLRTWSAAVDESGPFAAVRR